MIKDIIKHKANECYAPDSYKRVNETHTKECQQMQVKNYFNQTFDTLILQNSLLPYLRMDKNGSYSFSKYCNRKNRQANIYPYIGHSLSNTSDSFYLDNAKFDGKLILKNDTYTYVRGINPTKGFIVASSSPMGNQIDITGDPLTKKICPKGIAKPGKDETKCFHENLKNKDGSYQNDNTILSLYKNIKKHKISYVIMLADYLQVADKISNKNAADFSNRLKDNTSENPENLNKNCYCINKSDKYYPFLNETFIIKKPNHIDDSGYSVTGELDNECIKPILDEDENAKHYLAARELTLKHKNEKDYKFKHIHYKHFPDHNVPEGKGRKALLELVRFVKDKLDKGENVLVHCHGGVGRTGIFVTSVLTSGLDSTKNFDFFKFMIELRKHRAKWTKRSDYFKFIFESMALTKIK